MRKEDERGRSPRKVIYQVTYRTGRSTSGRISPTTSTTFAAPTAISSRETSRAKSATIDFTVRREILWSSGTATDREVAAKEVAFIRRLRSNHPEVGYNRWPPG